MTKKLKQKLEDSISLKIILLLSESNFNMTTIISENIQNLSTTLYNVSLIEEEYEENEKSNE